ncbi:MAG TPA: tetratricopeptide repeat protein [Candidatus Krumholzibacteria bacterium]|nr:tetratricopeptide repeat protein [Candidatus Krumholzibacteria bacterium]
MNRLLVVMFAIVLAPLGAVRAAGAGADLSGAFARGNAAYEAGDYDTALQEYGTVAAAGVVNADLFYNLGNACYEAGQLGRAVVWYERARRIRPRDGDIAANLELTRTMLRDKQLVVNEGVVRRAALAWHRKLSLAESVMIASALYGLLCALAILFVLRREPAVNAFLRRMSLFSPGRLFGLNTGQDVALAMAVVCVLAGLFAGSSFAKLEARHERSRGVIVADEVPVYSGPSDDATLQFKVHEGTTLAVRESRGGWIRVELPGELTGWIAAATLERI